VSIEKLYNFIEGLLWIVLSGFLLSFFIALLHVGWHGAGKQTGKLLAESAFRTPFLTTLLSRVVFGGVAFTLANWHPIVPPGFWDYTQMIVRFSLALILLSAGVLFWSLSLARQQVPKQDKSDFI
jgi:amino acid permease